MLLSDIDITFDNNFQIIIDDPQNYEELEDINQYPFEYIDYDFLDYSISKIKNILPKDMIHEEFTLSKTINKEEELINFITDYIIKNSLNMINNNNIKIYDDDKIENEIITNNEKINLTSYHKKNNSK